MIRATEVTSPVALVCFLCYYEIVPGPAVQILWRPAHGDGRLLSVVGFFHPDLCAPAFLEMATEHDADDGSERT